MIRDFFQHIMVKGMAGYIGLVYGTSKVNLLDQVEQLRNQDGEKLVALFWHGDSYCLYPAMKGLNLYIVVTRDRRGDYISEICQHFGYQTLRIPDATDGGNYLFQIRKAINGKQPANIAITLDGPIGEYHVPKDFALVTALLTKRRVMPISIDVKRKIRLINRWDKFTIPLPFNKIDIRFHKPVEVEREKGEDPLMASKRELASIMEL